MQNMEKRRAKKYAEYVKKYGNSVLNMENSNMSIFCICGNNMQCIMHSLLC
jgi:hypothetical protein